MCNTLVGLLPRWERIGNNDTGTEPRETACALDKRDMISLAWCIERHNCAIEYTNLIEGIYTWNNGFTILFGMTILNLLGLQILTTTSDFEATARLIVCTFTVLFLFIMDCYGAQKLMDHSINIGFNIYNNQWYSLPLEAQKFVQLMMMRCIVPCQLTAGKILILSVNTCGLTIRTAASYFTILRSTRGL